MEVLRSFETTIVIAGLDPAIHLKTMDARVKPAHDELFVLRGSYLTTDAVCPNKILRSSSVRLTGWPKFGLTSFALA
jgi:hypothetical protein